LYDSRILEIPPQPNIDSITWSPGRDQLAFSSISQIGLYDLRHHLRAQPLHAPSFVFYREVDWSGSGRYLAYVAYDMLARELPDNTAYVHLYDTRQQAITQVAIQRVHFERGIAPQWMRDDDRLVLAIPNYDHRTADGLPLALTELAWLDVSTQVFTPVAPQRIIGSSPALSADDTQVAYVGLTAIDEVPQIGVLRVGLAMPPAMLSQSDGYKVAPRWVFDNRAIVFDDYDSVNIHSNLTLRWLDRDETIVLPTLRVVYDFDVSPDQRWIAYLGTDRVQSLAVCVMSLETQEQRCRFDAAIKQGSRIAWAR
jgi:Tol biopolymer transport system component